VFSKLVKIPSGVGQPLGKLQRVTWEIGPSPETDHFLWRANHNERRPVGRRSFRPGCDVVAVFVGGLALSTESSASAEFVSAS